MSTINYDLLEGTIVKTRIRLARNLKGYPFRITNEQDAKEVVKKINRALVKCDTFNLYFSNNLTNLKLEEMKEKHLISNALIENKELSAFLLSADQTVSVMVHEEDVIREQCIMKGLCLGQAYNRLQTIDNAIAKNIDVAFSERLGYLTACPTNVGTGMRASVMLFLPALTESGKISSLENEMANLGLTIRGVYGEGSRAEGYNYQISNEVTLGVSEQDIISAVYDAVLRICSAERDQMQYLCGKQELKTMDRVKKSYGILTNAVLLDYQEFLHHIAQIKLGAMLGIININNISEIDDLIVAVRPAVLCGHYGKKLSATDRDLYRAEVVKQKLLKIKE